MNLSRFIFRLFVLVISMGLVSCNPPATPTAISATKTLIEISTPISSTETSTPPPPTATNTPIPTMTPTQTPSPTPTEMPLIPLATSLESDADIKNLPLITLEQLQSGDLVATERQMLQKGLISPLGEKAFLCEKYVFDIGDIYDTSYFFPGSDCDEYWEDRSKLPTKEATVFRMMLGDKEILVVGMVWLNGDGTYGFIHYGFESIEYKAVTAAVLKLMNHEAYIFPIGKIGDPDFVYLYKGFGIDLSKNQTIVRMFYTDNDGGTYHSKLLKTWAESRIIPPEAEKILFLGEMQVFKY